MSIEHAPSRRGGSSKLFYTVAEAMATLGIGRSSVYIMIAAGELKAKKFGHRTLVTGESLRAFADKLPDAKIGQKEKVA